MKEFQRKIIMLYFYIRVFLLFCSNNILSRQCVMKIYQYNIDISQSLSVSNTDKDMSVIGIFRNKAIDSVFAGNRNHSFSSK